MGKDNRFLKREKLINMSVGELRNYHEKLCEKYKKASPKMKKPYIDQITIVEEIINHKTGVKKEPVKESWFQSKSNVLTLIIVVLVFLFILFFLF